MNQDIKQNINKFTLKISPDRLNKDFIKTGTLESLTQVRSVYIMGIIIYISFVTFDYMLLDELTYVMIKIRLFGIVPLLAICLLLTFLKIYTKYAQSINISLVLIAGVGILFMSYISADVNYFLVAYSGLFLVMFFLYSFMKIHFSHAFFLGMFLSIGYLLVEHYILHPSSDVRLIHIFGLISANFIGILIAYSIEYQAKREYLLKRLISQALITDSLTDLYNRRYFEQVLIDDISYFIKNSKLAEDNRNSINNIDTSKYGLIMIDIDYFKKINDTFGHHSGDLVLQQFSTLLQDSVRVSDDVLRIGGEEFLLVLKLTDEKYLTEFVRKIGLSVSTHDFKVNENTTINCTISIGLVVLPCIKTDNIDKLIQYADKALYHSKDMGRNKGHKIYYKNNSMFYEEILWSK